jgi:hypothetical protein
MVIFRLIVSSAIAFLFYAAWAYYANSLVSSDPSILIKAALVQGIYSASITLTFTFLIEFFHSRFGHSNICLAWILPQWSKQDERQDCTTKLAIEASLQSFKGAFSGNALPGMLLVPIPALVIQTILVVTINLLFATPNL